MPDETSPPPQAQDAGDGDDTAVPSRKRKWLPRLMALGMGVGLICLAEGVLCLIGYGGPTAMFLSVPDGDGTKSWVSNQDAFRADFIRHPVLRHRGEFSSAPPQRFPVEKAPGSFRICVLGASTANGFPHSLNGSFAMFLRSILNRVQDGRRIEVFIAGCAALTSYSLLERLPEVRDYGADMVVVYCGHNEFYGLYGAGSSLPLSTHRPVTLVELWLGRRRLSMALGDLLAAVLPPPSEEDSKKGLAQALPERTDIRCGDPTYVRVRDNYEANLDAMVHRARAAGLSIVLCTPACNLRDFPPGGSLHDEATGPDDLARWRGASEAAEAAAAAGDAPKAADLWAQAVAASPGHAQTRFDLAKALDALGRHEEAYKEYRAAADRDTVRWRAGSDFADAVRAVARRHADEGVVLADCEAYLRKSAPDGIPGGTLFLEHVHPTLEGNFRAAESIAHAIADSPASGALAPWRWGRHGDLAYYEEQNGIDTFQRIACLESMIMFKRFVLGRGDGPPDPDMVADLRALRANLTEAQLAAAREATKRYPPEHGIPYDWLRICMAREYAARGETNRALRQMEIVRLYGEWQAVNPRYAELLATEAEILLQAGRPHLAGQKARQALGIAPGQPAAAHVLARTR